MKLFKIAVVALSLHFAGVVHAQTTDIATGFAQAQAAGTSLPDYVAQMTDLKTCNPKLAEQVIQFAIEQAKNDPVLVEQILKAVNAGCVDADALTALAIGAGLDPTLVANAIQSATAAAGTLGAGLTPAATPGNSGATGGTVPASTN